MVKLRLQRFGTAKKPFYRVVAADALVKRDGRFLEIVGTYDPINKNKDEQIKLDREKVLNWLKVGAQPTDTVKSLLKKSGLLKEFAELKKEAK
ncbi:MAG: 30S ribosomal protein S16 [Gammaproteobacteria bacterium]|nr:30S ribosomal protein S16 [Gammaproteobacteria bacterium]